MFDRYKESEAYKNKTKQEKRTYNQSAFYEDLRTNQKFAEHYELKCSKRGKAKDLNNILLGYRYIPSKPASALQAELDDDSEKEIEDDDDDCDIIKDEDEYWEKS